MGLPRNSRHLSTRYIGDEITFFHALFLCLYVKRTAFNLYQSAQLRPIPTRTDKGQVSIKPAAAEPTLIYGGEKMGTLQGVRVRSFAQTAQIVGSV